MIDIRNKKISFNGSVHMCGPTRQRLKQHNITVVTEGVVEMIVELNQLRPLLDYCDQLAAADNDSKLIDIRNTVIIINKGGLTMIESQLSIIANKGLKRHNVKVATGGKFDHFVHLHKLHSTIAHCDKLADSDSKLIDIRNCTIIIDSSHDGLICWPVNMNERLHKLNTIVVDHGIHDFLIRTVDLLKHVEYSESLLKEMENKSDITKEVSESILNKLIPDHEQPVKYYTQQMVNNGESPEVGMLTKNGIVRLGPDINNIWVTEEKGRYYFRSLHVIKPYPPVKSPRAILMDKLEKVLGYGDDGCKGALSDILDCDLIEVKVKDDE